MRKSTLSLTALILGLSIFSSPAFADPPEGRGHDRGDHGRPHSEHRHEREDINRSYHFSDENRDYARAYLHEEYERRCPPGLAKKHNGCRPPGQDRHYRIGGYLPPQYYRPLPPELQMRMLPPAPGTYYVMVDEDVLLVTEATHRIIDAITLLSAVR